MSLIADARATLHASLVAGCGPLIGADHVHRYVPLQLVTPCVWIAAPSLARVQQGSPGALLTVAAFGVYCSCDGVPPAQAGLLDELVAAVWDASSAPRLMEALRSNPQPVDVGGATLRAQLVDVEITLTARTLCDAPINP